MSVLDQTDITILLNKFGKEWKEQMDATMRKLTEFNLFSTISQSTGTNVLTATVKSPLELHKAIEKINEIPNVSLYYPQPDHLKEVSVAIENHEYFKAFTLCVTLYESYGKEIFFSDDPEFVSSSGKHIHLTKINGVFHNALLIVFLMSFS